MINNSKYIDLISGGTSLGQLVELLSSHEKSFADYEISLPKGFTDYDLKNKDSPRFHEAGYDAYATGHVFVKIYNALNDAEQDKVRNAVNLMRSFHYFKNRPSIEEPFYKEMSILFITPNSDEKINVSDITSAFENSLLKDLIRCPTVYQDNFNGVMLHIEPPT
jgi:hypothetical protein